MVVVVVVVGGPRVPVCVCLLRRVCVDAERVSHPGDVHDLDGCQLPRLNMATLVKARDRERHNIRREWQRKSSTGEIRLLVFTEGRTQWRQVVENIWGTK